MGYLKCEWCERNASTTIRLNTGKLTGICLDHLDKIPTEITNGTRHLAEGVAVVTECSGWGQHPWDCEHTVTIVKP